MIYPQLINYIQTQLTQGVTKEVIINTLLNIGWQRSDIDEAFNNLSNPPVVPPQNNLAAQNRPITENDYPVQFTWIYKTMVPLIFVVFFSILLLLFGFINYYLIFLILYSPIHFIITILRRNNFHYLIDARFMILKQGIISKQERNIPYGVIQNVFVRQDLFDRIFGLSSLAVENAAQGAGAKERVTKIFGMTVTNTKKQEAEMIGFKGNKASVPGLKREDAETLKSIILDRIKQNPIEDSQSGL